MITITGQVVSLKNSKQLFMNKRTGKMFISSSKASKQWVKDALWQLKTAQAITSYPVVVTMTFYFKGNHRKDLDNACSSVFDVLRMAGVIIDDDWMHIPEVHLKFGGVDKTNPRVEIVIQSVS